VLLAKADDVVSRSHLVERVVVHCSRVLRQRRDERVDAVGTARQLGFWVEVVSLVVPGFSDQLDGLRRLGDLVREVDADIPWHINAFQPRYKMVDRAGPAPELLVLAAGLRARAALRLRVAEGRCPSCATPVAGLWH
jgi:pyruvate-formate lyase-activating enzyme